MIDENYKHRSLTKAWCGMCNYFMSISQNGGCEKCPFKDSELCYDANEECDYDKFEELIKGIKINGEKDCKAREPRKIEPNKPHKLIDDFNKMKLCHYHDDWHYCCRCDFESICKWSNNKNNEALKRYIKENWGK